MLGIWGVFCLGICNEFLAGFRRYREVRLSRKYSRVSTPLFEDLIRSCLYGLQMVIAYFLMLVAMLYESFLFMSLIIGLMIGHFAALKYFRGLSQSTGSESGWQDKTNGGSNQTFLEPLTSGRTPCCGGS